MLSKTYAAMSAVSVHLKEVNAPLNLASSELNGDMDLIMMENDMKCTCAKAAFSLLWQH